MPSHQTDLSSFRSGKSLRLAYPPNVLTYCLFWGETAGWPGLEQGLRVSSEHLWNQKQDAGFWLLYRYSSSFFILPNHNLTLCPCLFLLSNWHTKSHVESGSLNWGTEDLPRSEWPNLVCNGFDCWLMCGDPVYCGQCHPRAGSPGMVREAGWAGARGSKPVSTSLPRSIPCSHLSSYPDFPMIDCYLEKEAKTNHLLPKLLLVVVSITATESKPQLLSHLLT